jgi:hypothetical protein
MADKTSFTGKIDLHEKTARPSNVGPHDPNKDQHDPDAPKRTPEDAYAAEVGGQAAIVGPRTLGKAAPVNIRVKGAEGDAPGQPDELAEPDAGVTEETKRKATGCGKADAGGPVRS